MSGGINVWIMYSDSGKAFECKNPLENEIFVWDSASPAEQGWDTGYSGLHISLKARSFTSVEQQCGFSMTLPFFTRMVEEASEQIASFTYNPSWFDERGTPSEKLESKSEFVRYATDKYPAVLDQLQELAESILDVVSIGRDRLESFRK
ncbi:MAG: hypothetical protein QGF48_09470 [Qipengyuania citrea]|jgi:hypothetical protein|nr:hypothetical protein [Qipengyuania citrea]|tara:strand:+ start:191 stop:637 length:447 start_codon:yes stop_codon:yes gene_type:complete